MEQNQEIINRQVNTLAILHFVSSGISLVGGLTIVLFYLAFGIGMIAATENVGGDDQIIFGIIGGSFIVVSTIIICFVIAFSIIKILAAIFLLKRKNRIFCIVVAGIESLNMPLGALLGVFTIVTLARPAVIKLFESKLKPTTNLNE